MRVKRLWSDENFWIFKKLALNLSKRQFKLKVYTTHQTHHLKKHLEDLKTKDVMKFERSNLVEKITEVLIESEKQLSDLDLNFFFNYEIFPKNIMIFETQWNDENRKMQVNDTIVQQAFLPPVPSFSQKVIFGVRISEIIDETNRKGFSYETLEGHVEKGVSTFTVEQADDKIKFKIHTFSKPGNLLTKIVGPIISVPYQAYCTRQALENVKKRIETQAA